MDWVTISALATAIGTLVLAVATFASVRSAQQAARTAERALRTGLRPMLMPSRPHDEQLKLHFVDGRSFRLDGGTAIAESDGDVVYLAISLRNVGNGIAVLHGWTFHPRRLGADDGRPDVASFRRLVRDLYVPAGDIGFFQGAFRDPAEPEHPVAMAAVRDAEQVTVELLYGDYEGGQCMISRIVLSRRADGCWHAASSRNWNLDGPDPRDRVGAVARRRARRNPSHSVRALSR